MCKKEIVKILRDINELKSKLSFKIIDTHVHPLDVMGVVHFNELINECKQNDYLIPGVLERFNYSRFEKIASRVCFKIFPGNINNVIKKTYDCVSENRIIKEMEQSLIDKSVLLSLDPWAPTKAVGEKYKNKDTFYILGSIDVHNVKEDEIEALIKTYIKNYKIVGIKLHPNLQNFKPQPSNNSPEIARKLVKIYETAANCGLYLLFHGGVSNYTDTTNSSYNEICRSRTNAILNNFCSMDGKSEIFGVYDLPIILAHIGHYGLVSVDYNLLSVLNKRYSKIFFDTSGISENVITNALKVIPSTKLIFGSDALYNRMAYNIGYAFLAAKKCNNGEKFEEIIQNIFFRNFVNTVI